MHKPRVYSSRRLDVSRRARLAETNVDVSFSPAVLPLVLEELNMTSSGNLKAENHCPPPGPCPTLRKATFHHSPQFPLLTRIMASVPQLRVQRQAGGLLARSGMAKPGAGNFSSTTIVDVSVL